MSTENAAQREGNRPTSLHAGRYQAPPAIPGVTDFGAWELFTWENGAAIQHGARLVPERAPWRGLFAALDAAGMALSDAPVTLRDEADAIVTCCWRYGSYFHVLTSGETYPPFARDPELSRLGNGEMCRINIEFSAGLAAWLKEREREPESIRRRVRAALQLLPMSWRTARDNTYADETYAPIWERLRTTVAEAEGLTPQPLPTVREEANSTVVMAYRNGPIENYHAGMWSQGTEVPGFKRFYAPEIKGLGIRIAEKLRQHLAGRQQADGLYLRYGLRAFTLGSGYNWSLTDETAAIDYPGMPGYGSLDARIHWLVARSPTIYMRRTSDSTHSTGKNFD